jgi:hypothetical protein
VTQACAPGRSSGIGHAFALAGRRHLGMLEIQDVVAERRLDQLSIAIAKRNDEARALEIMPNGHAASSESQHGE